MAREALNAKQDAAHVESKRIEGARRQAVASLAKPDGSRKKWSEMGKAERDDLVRVIALRLGLIDPE
jgi:hypothetical protein